MMTIYQSSVFSTKDIKSLKNFNKTTLTLPSLECPHIFWRCQMQKKSPNDSPSTVNLVNKNTSMKQFPWIKSFMNIDVYPEAPHISPNACLPSMWIVPFIAVRDCWLCKVKQMSKYLYKQIIAEMLDTNNNAPLLNCKHPISRKQNLLKERSFLAFFFLKKEGKRRQRNFISAGQFRMQYWKNFL